MENLWQLNSPEFFWKCIHHASPNQWVSIVRHAAEASGMNYSLEAVEDFMAYILGEAQFGDRHWEFSKAKRLYYLLRPYVPVFVKNYLRNIYHRSSNHHQLSWPIESRYIKFQFAALKELMVMSEVESTTIIPFWPNQNKCSIVLTHDVETENGQRFVGDVAALDRKYGFRSSFNFVLDRYPLDLILIDQLRKDGFEVGCHGMRHDGKMFRSKIYFDQEVIEINQALEKFNMVGFRSPFTHRNPIWMQDLNIEYDLSFFDTDPFEPIPGGTMSIWPFMVGKFVELPYTLVQDNTLVNVLGQRSPDIWIEKLGFIYKYHGMALVNVHPDYLLNPIAFGVYEELLQYIKKMDNYWNALPREVSQWWRQRNTMSLNFDDPEIPYQKIKKIGDRIEFCDLLN